MFRIFVQDVSKEDYLKIKDEFANWLKEWWEIGFIDYIEEGFLPSHIYLEWNEDGWCTADELERYFAEAELYKNKKWICLKDAVRRDPQL